MFSLHTVHKMTAQERFSGPPSCEKISTDFEGIMYWKKEGGQEGGGVYSNRCWANLILVDISSIRRRMYMKPTSNWVDFFRI